MTRTEYIQELNTIIENITLGNIEGVDEKLQELYHYKPVGLLWRVASAQYMLKQGRALEAWNSVAPYTREGIQCPGTLEFEQFQRHLYRYWNADFDLHKMEYDYGEQATRDKMEQKLKEVYDTFCQTETLEDLSLLMNHYLLVEQRVVFLIIRFYLIKCGFLPKEDHSQWYYSLRNNDYLEEKVLDKNTPFFLVADEDCTKECDILAYILHRIGHSVYILTRALPAGDKKMSATQSLELSLANRENYEDAQVIPVYQLEGDAETQKDNRGEIIRYLYENECLRHYGVVLATGTTMYQLLENDVLRRNIECLSEFPIMDMVDRIYFGWVGDYLQYCEDIYCYEVERELKEKLERPPEFDFSIVIPARNSAQTLYYTLKTCLNQDYKGSYEILVSDNSTDGKQEVFQVCRDLNDPHIRYVKTPRNLTLAKSFEYAFLQARGEFVLSIGSDDGICTFALSVLSDILKKYPDEEIIQWKRGYYGWPDFQNGNRDKLVIPERYKKEALKCSFVDGIDYFARILNDISWTYSLPTLYINSGFRRNMFKTLLDKTGRLWDGCNQDIYMGVMNAAIHDRILNIEFPLTIAGMSSQSLGYVGFVFDNGYECKEEDKSIRKSAYLGDNIGSYIDQGIVKEIPGGTGEVYSLYGNILRGIQLGVLPDSWKDELLDFKKIYIEFFEEHHRLNPYNETYLYYAKELAKRRGLEFETWYIKNILEPGLVPVYYIDKELLMDKTYKTGRGDNGGLIIDASEYGVDNIEKAVDLFEEHLYG